MSELMQMIEMVMNSKFFDQDTRSKDLEKFHKIVWIFFEELCFFSFDPFSLVVFTAMSAEKERHKFHTPGTFQLIFCPAQREMRRLSSVHH
jgi:hypothetical protein